MPGRYIRRPQSDYERLEGRGLLSLAVPARPAHLELAEGIRGAVGVALPTVTRSGAHSSFGASELDQLERAARPEVGSGREPVEGRAAAAAAFNRSGLQAMATREFLEPFVAQAHRNDVPPDDELSAVAADPSGAGGELAEVSAGGAALGWGPPGINGSAAGPETGAGLDGRAWSVPGSSPAAMPSGAFGDIVPRMPRAGEPRVVGGHRVDGDRDLTVMATGDDLEATDHALAELVDGALYPDWESIDREMRQLLGTIGGLPGLPDGSRAAWGWALWAGAAAALSVAPRASRRLRRPFRLAGARPARDVTDDPLSVAPWPLGPP